MNYEKIYKSLIQKRIKSPAKNIFNYSEIHHIIPRSLNRDLEKNPNNLVSLSAREHFIAHALLVKIYKQRGDKDKWYKMLCAFDAMSKLYGSIRNPELRYKNKSNSKLYEIWKIELSNYIKESGCMRGENCPNFGNKLYFNPNTNEYRFFKDGLVPNGWKKGGGPAWKRVKSTLNTKWVHNIETNENKCIKENELKQFLNCNPNYKIGMAPITKNHFQHFNPSLGKRWISNLILKKCKRINKSDPLPKDWLEGRIENFDIYLERYNDALTNKNEYHFIDFKKDIKNRIVPRILANKKKPRTENKNYQKYTLSKIENKEDKLKMVKAMFEEYKINKYEGVVKKFNYNHSPNAMYNLFRRYLTDK